MMRPLDPAMVAAFCLGSVIGAVIIGFRGIADLHAAMFGIVALGLIACLLLEAGRITEAWWRGA